MHSLATHSQIMDEPLREWIARLLDDKDLRGQGHAQRASDQNLGLGWIYYGLARLIRPRTVVVIGSLRGFAPLVLGRALAENSEGGTVWFVDPSLVDDFWTDPQRVAAHFAHYGLRNIRHVAKTTQEFVTTSAYRDLAEIGILLVDGYHTHEQARIDHEAFAGKLLPDGIVLFHDSTQIVSSGIYGEDRRYDHTVVQYMDELKRDPPLQVLDLPVDSGLTLVRRASSRTEIALS
jgi:predicted O-methyltransferase YrrM